MKGLLFMDGGFKEIDLHYSPQGQYLMGNEPVKAFTTTYMSVGGPKAKLMVWVEDEELGGFYDNWNTWLPARDMAAAWLDAKSWAHAEEIPAIQGIE